MDLLPDILRVAAQAAKDPRRFGGYREDPVGFARDILGIPLCDPDANRPGLWGKQVELLEAIRAHRLIAAKSGNGVGKTFCLGLAVLWWTYARQGTVITTAQTWEQTEKVLWGAIAKLHRSAVVPLPGDLMLTELRIEPGWAAVGLNVENPVALQGRHDARQLVVVDEAEGIPEKTWDALLSLVTGEENKLCAIANPLEASGTFHAAFEDPDWCGVTISCLDHPNVQTGRDIIPGAVTRKWVELQRRRYGEGSSGWLSHVLGEFPLAGSNQLIAMAWIQAMQQAALRAEFLRDARQCRVKPIFAVDVARYGQNLSVIAIRQGQVIHDLIEQQGMATTELEGRIIAAAAEWQPEAIIVDEPGIGGGVLDHLIEAGLPAVGFMPGARASNPRQYRNLRTECWWRLRERLQEGTLALPVHPELSRELTAQQYKFHSSGALFVTPKEQLDTASPDRGDAVMMTLALDLPTPEEEVDLDDTSRDPAIIGRGDGLPANRLPDDDGLYGGMPSWY